MKSPLNVPLINKFIVVILIVISGNVYGQRKTFSHYDFPPLYKFDDYDFCLTQKHNNFPSNYCMVYAEVKPNNSSQMWQHMMQHYEEFPFRYRRDHLFFGVCVKRCMNNVNMSKFKNEPLIGDDLLKNEITEYFEKVHKRPLDKQFRQEYHNLIHNCINEEFKTKYDLDLRTYIEYCEGSGVIDETNKDPLESLLYKIIGIIVVLNVLSTLYDCCLKLQQPKELQNNDFYKVIPQKIAPKLLTSFSVCRNYYRLTQPCISDTAKDFRFLDGFRSVCMMLAIAGHTFFLQYQHIANPQYCEKSSTDQNSLWFYNTTSIIETYYVMSGLLLFIKFQQSRFVTPQTSWKQFVITYIKLLLFRYIRFFPSIGLLILVNATILTRLQDGPFWRHITEPVFVFSRERGWRNLLMINNFSHKESASHHTWYIATDWQLFALYLLVIMIVSKYPQYKKHIYFSLAILSFLITFSISYFFKLQPCFIIKPETLRYSFLKDIDVYYKIYTPFYTNLYGYLFGIICAEIYLKYTRREEIRKLLREQPKYTIVAHFLSVLAFLIFWLGAILDVQAPSLWSALYAGLHRIIWDTFVCGIPLLFMSCNCGWMAYEFCCLPIFRLLARLSFQVYIWHITIVYLINGYQRQPYYVNTLYFFTQLIISYCLSNALAFVIALFIEYPIAQSVQALQSTKTHNNKNTKKSS